MKPSTQKMLKTFGISFVVVIFLAIMDLQGKFMFDIFGGFSSEVYTKIEMSYMSFFWSFALGIILITSLVYYLFKKDKSETLALIFSQIILIWSGWEDLFYYAIGGFKLFGTTLPWLNNNLFINIITKVLGGTVVTPITLIISAVIGLGISIGIYKYLEKI